MREKYRFKVRWKNGGEKKKLLYMPAAVYNEHIYNIVMYRGKKKEKKK